MPQLNPTPWFYTMTLTWITMMWLLTKLTNTPTPIAPFNTDNPTACKTRWPW